MSTKRVVKKSTPAKKTAAKKSASAPRVVPNAEQDHEANQRAREGQETPDGPPAIHAKSVQIILSVGTDDRDRTFEEFVEEIRKKIDPVPYGEYIKDGKRAPGIHMTQTGGYYILDGKVCLPGDYDPKTQNFKKGAVPPVWAGGPDAKAVPLKTQLERDLEELSSDEYDKKYGLGKYKSSSNLKVITPEMQRRALEEYVANKKAKEDDDLEEFDWDEDNLDDETLGAVADASASEAIKKMKGTKKRVVKKPAKKAATTKRVVKKGKK